jgi:hypothetical protein
LLPFSPNSGDVFASLSLRFPFFKSIMSKVTLLFKLLKDFPTGTLVINLVLLASKSSSNSSSESYFYKFLFFLTFSFVLRFFLKISTESIVLVNLWGSLNFIGVCIEWYLTSLDNLIEFSWIFYSIFFSWISYFSYCSASQEAGIFYLPILKCFSFYFLNAPYLVS